MIRRMYFPGALLLIAAALLLWEPLSKAVFEDPGPPTSTTTTTTPGPPVLVGSEDPEPPVISGGAATWEELFTKVGDNSQYWACFTSRTGHSKAEAFDALVKEKSGWNVAVTLVSNTSAEVGDQTLDSKGLTRDPDVVQLSGFSNTRGAGEGGCQAFDDSRAQVRVALTLPGKDKNTPGLPVALSHCGNPIGYPQGPPPPAKPRPQPKPKPKPPVTSPPKVTVPPTTKPPAPTTTWKCQAAVDAGRICGGGGAPGTPAYQPPAPVPTTPGYIPGTDTHSPGTIIPTGGTLPPGSPGPGPAPVGFGPTPTTQVPGPVNIPGDPCTLHPENPAC